MAGKVKCAIVGSGNIGADLMIKVMRTSDVLEMGAMVGIDPDSDGLARARKLGVAATHEGMDGLVKMPVWKDIEVVFDALAETLETRCYAVCRLGAPDSFWPLLCAEGAALYSSMKPGQVTGKHGIISWWWNRK